MALAEALTDRGVACHFDLRGDNGYWAGQLPAYAEVRPGMSGADGVIFDDYTLRDDDIQTWAASAGSLAEIYDGGAMLAAATTLLCPSLLPDFVSPGRRTFAGPAYALLPGRYAAPLPARQPRTRPRVVAGYGFTDSAGLTEKLVRVLAVSGWLDRIDLVVVIGGHAPSLPALRSLQAQYGFQLLVNASDMIAIYDDADLAFGAGGVSLLERLSRGLPSVTTAVAANQEVAVAYAAGRGTTVALDASAIASAAVAELLAALLADRERCQAMSAAGRQLVDGRGAQRAAAALLDDKA